MAGGVLTAHGLITVIALLTAALAEAQAQAQLQQWAARVGRPPPKRPPPRRSPPPRRQPPPGQRAAPPHTAPVQRPPPGRTPPRTPPAAPSLVAPSPAKPSPREGNGVRLVGGSGPRGRLEVSSRAGWLTNYTEGAVAWRPVCSYAFSDELAADMCALLSYPHGRQYYSPDVSFRPPNASATSADNPVGYLDCEAVASPPTDPTDLSSSSSGSARRLLAPLTGDVDIPAGGPYACSFRKAECAYTGPMAGIECSWTEFPPAPPPPPSPPTPPDGPPSYQPMIRAYGGGYNFEYLEPNLCALSDDPPACRLWQRADLLLPHPGGAASGGVWAPLCGVSNTSLAYSVADIACKQLVDWPNVGYASVVGTSYTAVPLPEGPQPDGAGVFRPDEHSFWAQVQGGGTEGAIALQQLQLQVSSTPCTTGVFVFTCVYADD